jgi:hypothetical protein
MRAIRIIEHASGVYALAEEATRQAGAVGDMPTFIASSRIIAIELVYSIF